MKEHLDCLEVIITNETRTGTKRPDADENGHLFDRDGQPSGPSATSRFKRNSTNTTHFFKCTAKDLDQNSEFRIKYPRGELGQSSGESELFMLVEHMAGQITKMEDADGVT